MSLLVMSLLVMSPVAMSLREVIAAMQLLKHIIEQPGTPVRVIRTKLSTQQPKPVSCGPADSHLLRQLTLGG